MAEVVVSGAPVRTSPPVKTKPFVFTGEYHTHVGQRLEKNDVVFLTEAQARAFADKFAPYDDRDFQEVPPEKANVVHKADKKVDTAPAEQPALPPFPPAKPGPTVGPPPSASPTGKPLQGGAPAVPPGTNSGVPVNPATGSTAPLPETQQPESEQK